MLWYKNTKMLKPG